MTFVLKTAEGLELMTANEADAMELARRYTTQNNTTVSVQRVLTDEDGTLLPHGPAVQVGQVETP
jgi:hypothetical protein